MFAILTTIVCTENDALFASFHFHRLFRHYKKQSKRMVTMLKHLYKLLVPAYIKSLIILCIKIIRLKCDNEVKKRREKSRFFF